MKLLSFFLLGAAVAAAEEEQIAGSSIGYLPVATYRNQKINLPPFGPPVTLRAPGTYPRQYVSAFLPPIKVDSWIPVEYYAPFGYVYQNQNDGLEYVLTEQATRPVLRGDYDITTNHTTVRETSMTLTPNERDLYLRRPLPADIPIQLPAYDFELPPRGPIVRPTVRPVTYEIPRAIPSFEAPTAYEIPRVFPPYEPYRAYPDVYGPRLFDRRQRQVSDETLVDQLSLAGAETDLQSHSHNAVLTDRYPWSYGNRYPYTYGSHYPYSYGDRYPWAYGDRYPYTYGDRYPYVKDHKVTHAYGKPAGHGKHVYDTGYNTVYYRDPYYLRPYGPYNAFPHGNGPSRVPYTSVLDAILPPQERAIRDDLCYVEGRRNLDPFCVSADLFETLSHGQTRGGHLELMQLVDTPLTNAAKRERAERTSNALINILDVLANYLNPNGPLDSITFDNGNQSAIVVTSPGEYTGANLTTNGTINITLGGASVDPDALAQNLIGMVADAKLKGMLAIVDHDFETPEPTVIPPATAARLLHTIDTGIEELTLRLEKCPIFRASEQARYTLTSPLRWIRDEVILHGAPEHVPRGRDYDAVYRGSPQVDLVLQETLNTMVNTLVGLPDALMSAKQRQAVVSAPMDGQQQTQVSFVNLQNPLATLIFFIRTAAGEVVSLLPGQVEDVLRNRIDNKYPSVTVVGASADVPQQSLIGAALAMPMNLVGSVFEVLSGASTASAAARDISSPRRTGPVMSLLENVFGRL